MGNLGTLLLAASALGLASGTPAGANDKPIIAPAAAWVKPGSLPADDGKHDQAAVRLLLSDEQARLTPGGGEDHYTEIAMRIQTPEGLQAAGTIGFAWQPDLDTLTIHKLHIVRDGKVIDVLAGGQQFTVLRRETGLEAATLDGVLTATLQPEGLQVGDVLDYAFTIRRVDPATKGHVEAVFAAGGGEPASRIAMRAEWPSRSTIRWRQAGDMPPAKRTEAAGTVAVGATADNLPTPELPAGAPSRFALSRDLEFTDFASWADLAQLMAPLYVKASAIAPGSALAGEVSRIAAETSDPTKRTEAALALVQDRVRYFNLSINDGGLLPADAETTWARRYGDCKGKTALLLGLLHALGIAADPVIVSSSLGDGLDQHLPMIGLFDHVLVRAEVAGKTTWLDGTRQGDRSLAALKVPFFHWGLPLVAEHAALVPIVPPPLDRPEVVTTVALDASAGIALPAKAHVERRVRGDGGLALSHELANMAPDARERGLRAMWRGKYDWFTPTTVRTSFDAETGDEVLSADGTATMDWQDGRYETDDMGIGYDADFTREPGVAPDAPFAVDFPSYTEEHETIVLPNGGTGFTLDDASYSRTLAGVEYRRSATLRNGIVTLECSERSVAPEFAAKGAAADQAELRRMGKLGLYVRVNNLYKATAGEVAAQLGKTPVTAQDYLARGLLLADRMSYPDAIAAFTKAIALDAKNASALANRAASEVQSGDKKAAVQDIAAALALDPRESVAFVARGNIAREEGRLDDAIAAYTTALTINPTYAYALFWRADCLAKAHQNEGALKDLAALILLYPREDDLYLKRANLFTRAGKRAEALGEAAALSAADPDNEEAHVIASAIYSHYDDYADALKEADRAIAIKPTVAAYLNRVDAHPPEDIADRQADVANARKLSPADTDVVMVQARVDDLAKNYAAAVDALSVALAAHPKVMSLLLQRGIDYARTGRPALADKDFADARELVHGSSALNAMCWQIATAGVALPAALAACDAALTLSPADPPTLDSRGFVLLRMGRFADAIAAYDRALAVRPAVATSLLGRALAEAGAGEAAKADADRVAALKADPAVQQEFQRYGVEVPAKAVVATAG